MRWDDDDDAAQLMFVDAGMPGQKLFIFGFRTGIRTGVGMAVGMGLCMGFISAAEKLSRSSLRWQLK